MNATSQNCLKTALRCGLIATLTVWGAVGQTLVNLGTQGRNVDFSNAPATRPVKTGSTLPSTCAVGDLFFLTSAPDGQNLFGCSAAKNWVILGGPPPLFFYQTIESDGTNLPQEPALNFSSAFSVSNDTGSSATDVDLAAVNSSPGTFGSSSQVPVVTVNAFGLITGISTVAITGGGGAIWGSITGTLSNQTDLENALGALQPTGNYLTALTGDVTALGPGAAAATLATVNSGPGLCGDATHVCQVTTDAKGRVTTQAAVAISAGGSGTVTHTKGALTAGQLIIGNGSGDITTGDLSGDVVTSGTTATILATINSTPGLCGDATHVCQVTTDAKGRVTAQAPVAISAGGSGTVTHTKGALTAGQLIIGNGSGDITTGDLSGDVVTSGTTATILATINSTPGLCGDATHVCQVTTDAKGRVTSQAPVAISAGGTGTVTHTKGALTAGQLIIGNGSGDITTGDLSGDVVTSGTTATILATINSTPGLCGDATHVCQVTTDAKGRVTGQTAVSISAAAAWGSITGTLSSQTDLETALNGKQATGNYLTALTGPVTAAGPGSSASVITPTGVTAGDYTNSNITVNAAGQITAASNGSTSSSTIWGTITGTLSSQTDLQSALDAKQNSLTFPLSVANGGTGTATPGLVEGSNITVTGSWPNQTISATAGGGTDNWSAGTLASIPATCTPGSGIYLYFAIDQPAAQQIYTCSATNTWTQFIGLGGSGALQIVAGSLDINTAIVSQQAAAETLGFKTFAEGLSLLTASTQPACTSANRGTFWYLNNGSSKDNVQVCVWNGSAFTWVSLY